MTSILKIAPSLVGCVSIRSTLSDPVPPAEPGPCGANGTERGSEKRADEWNVMRFVPVSVILALSFRSPYAAQRPRDEGPSPARSG